MRQTKTSVGKRSLNKERASQKHSSIMATQTRSLIPMGILGKLKYIQIRFLFRRIRYIICL